MQILLVEDDLKLGKLTKLMIESKQHIVTWVTDGRDALDYIETSRYDIVLMDWMLPSMEGIEVVRAIREQKMDVPIIMMTAKGTLDDKVTGFQIGADDYIVKPFDFEELEVRMLALTRRFSGRVSEKLIVGPIEIDLADQMTHVNGNHVLLKKKEYLLLTLLMHHAHHIVTRDLIFDKVWSIDDEVTDNAIEALIRRLRKKLGDSIAPYQIKVIRNMGYSLTNE